MQPNLTSPIALLELMQAGAFGVLSEPQMLLALDPVGYSRWQAQTAQALSGILRENAHRLAAKADPVAALETLLTDRYWKREKFVIQDGVGVFAIHGPLQKGEDFYTRYGYATSLRSLAQIAGQLGADASVKSLLAYVDSPGGTVEGTSEAANALFEVREKKPVVAHVSGFATSAAQWLAAQASATLVEPDAMLGSIGVRWQFMDISQALEERGVRVTSLTTGTFKDAGSPYRPMTEADKAYFMGLMQDSLAQFSAAIQRGRGIDEEAIVLLTKDAALLTATQAMSAGLADEIATRFDATLAQMGNRLAQMGRKGKKTK